jgi:flavin reductase (DIM6/NTAB) family NADH-FMN oxidoreductase RutF
MHKVKIKNYPFGPFPVMIIGTMVNGKPNYTTAGAGGCVCHKPVLSVSLNSIHQTTCGIKETGYFSVNIPSSSLLQKTDYCGIVSGKTSDKSKLFTAFFDELADTPMIEECSMSFLCKVFQTVEIHGFDMFFGDLLATYISEECMNENIPDPVKIDPLLLMGANYCSLGKVVGRAFHEGKKQID